MTGWRIAQAEMFFMIDPAALASVEGRDVDLFALAARTPPAVATTRSLPVSPSVMITPASGTIPDTRTARRSTLFVGVDDQHIAALVVGQHRRLRQHGRARALLDRDLGARERAGPQRRIRLSA